MKKLLLSLICFIASIVCYAQTLYIYGGSDHDVFLGCLNTIQNLFGMNMEPMVVSTIQNPFGTNMGPMAVRIVLTLHGMTMLLIHL